MFRDGFRALDADLVTLQETVLTDQVDQAAAMLGDGYYFDQQESREQGRPGVPDRQGITTASKWPLGRIFEVDLHLTKRTSDFACTCLVTEVLAPDPYGRVWVANHFPDYQLDHERERRLQAVGLRALWNRWPPTRRRTRIRPTRTGRSAASTTCSSTAARAGQPCKPPTAAASSTKEPESPSNHYGLAVDLEPQTVVHQPISLRAALMASLMVGSGCSLHSVAGDLRKCFAQPTVAAATTNATTLGTTSAISSDAMPYATHSANPGNRTSK
jgi:hypothetical protein